MNRINSFKSILWYVTTFSMTVVFTTGCSILKARSAPSTSFLAHGEDLAEMRGRAPFHGVWYKDKDSFYTTRDAKMTVSVADVEEGALMELKFTKPSEFLNSVEGQEAHEVAQYLKSKFVNSLQEVEKSSHFSYTEQPDSTTLVIELAITELHPTNPIFNIAGTTAGFFIPGGGIVSRLGSGSISIEGRLRDGSTGEILLEFKDRESDKLAVVNIKDFQRYAHVRQIIDEWSMQFVELLTTPPEHMVDDSSPVTLLPY